MERGGSRLIVRRSRAQAIENGSNSARRREAFDTLQASYSLEAS